MSEPDAPFEIPWSGSASRALRRLPEKVATAAVEFVYGALADNPHRVGRALRFELQGRHGAHLGTTGSSTASTISTELSTS